MCEGGDGGVSVVRYQVLRLCVGFCLLVLAMLPIQFLIGYLTWIMPAGIAVGMGVIAWISGTVLGAHVIAKNLRKRWEH